MANAGPNQSGDLGDNFALSFCQSTFDSASLCSFAASYLAQNFSIEWLLGSNSLGFSQSSAPFILDTSADGALFNNPGTYTIMLDIGYLGSGSPLTSSDSMNLQLTAAHLIEEPGAAEIFLIGLGAIGLACYRRRIKKTRRKAAA